MNFLCKEVNLAFPRKKKGKAQGLTSLVNASPTYILRGVVFVDMAVFCMSLLGFSSHIDTLIIFCFCYLQQEFICLHKKHSLLSGSRKRAYRIHSFIHKYFQTCKYAVIFTIQKNKAKPNQTSLHLILLSSQHCIDLLYNFPRTFNIRGLQLFSRHSLLKPLCWWSQVFLQF